MASKDPQMSKQGIFGKGKHGTSTIPKKLKIIRRIQSAKYGRGTLASCYIGLPTMHDIEEQQKEHLQICISTKLKCV
jgi:hypothetical protein